MPTHYISMPDGSKENGLETNRGLDYNMGTLQGRGVFKGDMLSLYNHCPRWYGEGDEHIWIDNEKFPSHFGCGTEDYYNTTSHLYILISIPLAVLPGKTMRHQEDTIPLSVHEIWISSLSMNVYNSILN